MVNASQHCKRWLQLVASTKVAIVVVLSVTTLCLSLQVQASPKFQHLATEDGLPQAVVHAITQETQGFMWLATQSDVARYDGYQFKTFRHDPADPASISQDWVRQISGDSRGNLWFATDTAGICRTSNNTGRFQCIKHDPNNHNSLASNEVKAMVADANDILWVGGKAGLNKLDLTTQRFTQVTTVTSDPNVLSSNVIYALHEDTQGDLWIGTDRSGINRWRLSDRQANRNLFQRYSRAQGLPDATVHAILSESTGILWWDQRIQPI